MDADQRVLMLRAWRLNSLGFSRFASLQEAEAYLKAKKNGIFFTNALNRVIFLSSLVVIILAPFIAEITIYILLFGFYDYFGTIDESDVLIMCSTFIIWIMIMYFIGFLLLRHSNTQQPIEFKLPTQIIQRKVFQSINTSFLTYGLFTLVIAFLVDYFFSNGTSPGLLLIGYLVANSELPHGTIHGFALLSFIASYSIAKYFEYSRRFCVVEWAHTGKWKEQDCI